MKITVKLFASLQNGRFDKKEFQCGDGITIKDLMAELEIPEDHYFITFINNRHVDHKRVLSDGDSLSVFPAVGGG